MEQRIINFLKQNKELFQRPINKIDWKKVYKLALDNFDTNLGKFTEFWLNKGIHPEKYLSELPGYFLKNTDITSFEIPNNVTSIGFKAFCDCYSLTNVIIPDSVTSINHCAFQGCKSLESMTIGNNVTGISDDAFRDCRSLTSVVIPNSVTRIGRFAFHNCKNLTSIEIPDSVTYIGYEAFYECSNLKFNEYENACYLGNKTDPYTWLIKAKNKNITSITIHENTKFIYTDAFSGCTSLTSVTIPNSVTHIGVNAFQSCYNLVNVVIPDSVKSIEEDAFWNCGDKLIVEYNGSKSRFKGLTKGVFKNTYFTAHCNDGDIIKKKR